MSSPFARRRLARAHAASSVKLPIFCANPIVGLSLSDNVPTTPHLRCSRRAKTKIPWTYIFVEIYDAYIFGIYYNFIKWPFWNSDGVSEGPKLEFWPSGTALVFQKGQNKNIINIYLCFTSTGAYTRRKGLWLEQYICWNICCIYVRYTWKIFDIYFSKMALLEQWWCWHTMYIPS